MNHNKTTGILVTAAFFLFLGIVGPASAVVIEVNASALITNPQDTGIEVTAGQVLRITSDPGDTWSLGPTYDVDGKDLRTCNAAGIPKETSVWGQYTYDGLTFNYGAMVGKIGENGAFFLVGTEYGPVTLASSGRLYLLCWDDVNYKDNTESIRANINVAPLPASALLLGSGLVGLGFLGWRRKRT